MSENRNSLRPPFWPHVGVGLVAVLVAAIATFVLENTRLMRALEMINLDALLISQNGTASTKVALVDIDALDYKQFFNRTSPLEPECVKGIIEAIAKSGARAIIVDLDTSDWSTLDLPQWLSSKSMMHTPVVWARAISSESVPDAHLEDVVGRNGAALINDPTNASICWGVPEVLDSGGLIRSYHSYVALRDDSAPSLARAAVLAYEAEPFPASLEAATGQRQGNCALLAQDARPGDLRLKILKYGHRFPRYHARDVLNVAGEPAYNALKGKIVVLGGTFPEAKDAYWTPIGRRDGAEILENAIEAESSGSTVHEPSSLSLALVEITLGMVIVLATYPFRRRLITTVMVLSITAALVFVLCFLLYESTSYFFSFAPLLVGLLIHEEIVGRHEPRGKQAGLEPQVPANAQSSEKKP